MSEVIRGTRHGLFTFRRNEFGPDVLMSWDHWKDQLAWAEKIRNDMHVIMLLLTPPSSEEDILKARTLAATAVAREVEDDGFVERRGQ